MRLTGVVNGDSLVKTLDWLALKHAKVYCLLKTLLAEVVYPLKYFHTAIAIILYTYQYNQLIKRNTHLSLVHVIVTYIWLARVCTMKKDACTNHSKVKFL